jgi:hemerythrin superfamily protein
MPNERFDAGAGAPGWPAPGAAAMASPAPDAGEDVVHLLTGQHRRLEALLKVLLKATSGVERARLLARACDELAVHIGAEEVVFYPAVRALRNEDLLLESLEEHLSLKRLVADLLALSTLDETFAPKCKVLEEQTRHHHQEEEDHVFPEVIRRFGAAERAHLGAAVRAHENTLRRQGAPREGVATQTDAAAPLA